MAQAKRKKKFFNVEIPLINRTVELFAFEQKDLNNRFIKYDMTRMLKGKSVELQLKVKADENEAVASPRQIRILPYYLKRMVRKGTNYVEDSFSAPCANTSLKVKPFLITRRKVSRAVRKALREKAREEITNYLKDKTTEQIFEDVLRNNLQKPLSLILKKIYPLSLCEIRVLKVENKK